MGLKINQAGNQFQLIGIIDENADLKPMEAVSGSCRISFKNITRINSCGVRDFINALKKGSATEILYEECPQVIVKQVNAVPDFLGNAKVLSFYAPYYCETCDKDENKLVLSANIQAGKPPEVKCDDCSKPMTFDAIPNQYFGFLSRQKP